MPTRSITGSMRSLVRLVSLGSLMVILFGCSTASDHLGGTPAPAQADPRDRITSAEVDGFLRQVKAVRGDAEAIHRLALHFQQQGRHAWAIDEFRRVLTVDPAHARAYNGIGVSHDHLGRYHLAAEAYGRALALDPSFHEAWNNLGYSALLGGDAAAAVHSFRRAIALEGRNPRYHNNLGLAYARLGQEAQAYAEFRLAGGETEAQRHMARLFPPPPHPDGAGAPVMAASASHPSKVTGMTSSAENTLASVAASMPSAAAASLSPSGSRSADPGLAPLAAAPASGQECPSVKEAAVSGGQHRTMAREERNGRSAEPFDEVLTAPVPSPIQVVMEREAHGFRIRVQPPEALTAPTPHVDGPQPVAPHPPAKPPAALPALATSRPEIQVSNGNGVRRMAAQVGRHLGARGFAVGGVDNAAHFNHLQTVIYYRQGFLQAAYQLARTIPGFQNMEKVTGFTRPGTAIHLVLGKDMLAHRRRLGITG